MATVKNTVKKLEKLTGLTVQTNDVNEHWVIYKGYVISFYPNGHFTPESEATCFYTKREDLKDDTNTDYFAGCFHDNIVQCVKHVERMVANK